MFRRHGPGAGVSTRRGHPRHESSDEFDRHIARIDPLVDLARLDKKRVSRIVGSRRTSFMFALLPKRGRGWARF